MQGGVGWQGIIPSRAAKMGSIAVDKGIAKVGSPRDFYEQLDPDRIAEQILITSRSDMRDLVDRIMEREHPQLWHELPPRVREAVHERVQEQLPEIVREVTDKIGDNIDDLLDVEADGDPPCRGASRADEPGVPRRRQEGARLHRPLRRRVRLHCGFPLILATNAVPHWWVLPILRHDRGLRDQLARDLDDLRAQRPAAGRPIDHPRPVPRAPAPGGRRLRSIVADDIVTVRNIGNELLHGPRSDRTRKMIQNALRPAVDRATGCVRRSSGLRSVRASTTRFETRWRPRRVDYTMTPFRIPSSTASRAATSAS